MTVNWNIIRFAHYFPKRYSNPANREKKSTNILFMKCGRDTILYRSQTVKTATIRRKDVRETGVSRGIGDDKYFQIFLYIFSVKMPNNSHRFIR